MKNTKSDLDVYVDHCAEEDMIDILANLFNRVAFMDPYAVRYNMELASGAMSLEDRTMDAEFLDYFIDNFCIIFYGLICNDTFRDAVVEAVSVEILLDEKDRDFVQNIRQDMKDDRMNSFCMGDRYTLDFSTYDECEFQRLRTRLIHSFEMIEDRFGDALDDTAYEFAEREDKMLELGFISSNFAYLYRAINYNQTFAHYIMSVLGSVKAELGIVI
jgi:hypothetical protein